MTKAEFTKLLEDAALAEGLGKCASSEEAVAFLKGKGIEATAAELDAIREEMTALSDDDLEDVAGGGGAEAAEKVNKAVETAIRETKAFFKKLKW